MENRLDRASLAILLLLTTYVVFVALYIEIMNVKAGGRLPNREYSNGDPAQGVVKWRGGVFNKTPEEYANGKLRSFVSTFGLTQYLCAPLLVLLSIISIGLYWRAKERYFFLASGSAGIVACALVFYRAYFTSLGW